VLITDVSDLSCHCSETEEENEKPVSVHVIVPGVPLTVT
jgi:hypothetical protein